MATGFYDRFMATASNRFPYPGKGLAGGDKPPEDDIPNPYGGGSGTAPTGAFNDNVGGGNTAGTPNVGPGRIKYPGRTNIWGADRSEGAVNTRGNTNTDGFYGKPTNIGGGNVIGPGGGSPNPKWDNTKPGGMIAPGVGRAVAPGAAAAGAGNVGGAVAPGAAAGASNVGGAVAPGAAISPMGADGLTASSNQLAPGSDVYESLKSLLTPGAVGMPIRGGQQSKLGQGGGGGGISPNPGPAAIANQR